MAPQHSPIGTISSTFLHQDAGCDKSLCVMLKQEQTSYTCSDYLGQRQAGPHGGKNDHQEHQAHKISPSDRAKIVEWCYAFVDLCRFDRESVAFTMSVVDRFMSTPSGRQNSLLHDRGEYQLLAVTALYASIKIYERSVISSEDFSVASHGTYATEEIESMELEMLHGLEWRMCPPTVLQVGCRVLNLMEARVRGGGQVESSTFDFLRDEVAYQSENAVRGYTLSIQCPSTVAIASILNAIEQVSEDAEHEQLMSALVSCVLREEYHFDSHHVIAETRDRLQSLVEGGDEQQAGTEDAPEEDAVARLRHSLDEDNEFAKMQALYDKENCSVDAVPAVSFVGDGMDDDVSFSTVHY